MNLTQKTSKPTKIIFLDVDGVLNSESFFIQEEQKQKIKVNQGLSIDFKKVKLLNKIVEATGAKIVISSTWRLNHYDLLLSLFSTYGFKGEILGKTEKGHCFNCVRGNLILQWMKTNENLIGIPYYNYYNYVILDDSTDMLYWQRNNFVNINNKIGLNKRNARKAIKILNRCY